VVLLNTPLNLGFWQMLRSSLVTEQLFVPQEGLGTIEALNENTNMIWWVKFWCCQNHARKICGKESGTKNYDELIVKL
jgi:hypothetical protein